MQQKAKSGVKHGTVALAQHSIVRTWDVSVGILGRSRDPASITGEGERLLSPPKHPGDSGADTISYSRVPGAVSQGKADRA
jgi:hypothetical protein